MLLALTVLSATFLGLVGILLLYGYRNARTSHEEHSTKLQEWLHHHQVKLPSLNAALAALNKRAAELVLSPVVKGEVSVGKGAYALLTLAPPPPPPPPPPPCPFHCWLGAGGAKDRAVAARDQAAPVQGAQVDSCWQ